MKDETLTEVWFMCKLRVRYQETDQMGVVYHANYLNWFEIGRTEFIREMGFPYRDIEKLGLLLPVTSAELQFKQSAHYDDLIRVYVRVNHFTPLRIEFEVQVRRDLDQDQDLTSRGLLNKGDKLQGELLVKGMTKHVWINTTWKPVRIDKEAPEIYTVLKDLYT